MHFQVLGFCVACLNDCHCGINQFCAVDPSNPLTVPALSLSDLKVPYASGTVQDPNNREIFQYAQSFQGLPLISKCLDYDPPSITQCVMEFPHQSLFTYFSYMSVVEEVPWGQYETTPTTLKKRDKRDFRKSRAYINPKNASGNAVTGLPALIPFVPWDFNLTDHSVAGGFCGQLNTLHPSLSLSNFAPAFFTAVYEDPNSKPSDRNQDFADPSSASREELSTNNNYDTAVFCSKVCCRKLQLCSACLVKCHALPCR